MRVSNKPFITVYRVPRDYVDKLKDTQEMKSSGIYLLVNSKERTVYVGQSGKRMNGKGILNRMLEPHQKAEIDNWDVGFILMTPSSYHETELNWLENYFFTKAYQRKNYKVLNGMTPHTIVGDDWELELKVSGFIDDALYVLKEFLKCDVYAPAAENAKGGKPISMEQEIPEDNEVPVSPVLYLESKTRGAKASGVVLPRNRFKVFKGSVISGVSTLQNESNTGYADLRNRLKDDGTIVNNEFVMDYIFNRSSPAASVILGRSANGNDEWKTIEGKALKDIGKE